MKPVFGLQEIRNECWRGYVFEKGHLEVTKGISRIKLKWVSGEMGYYFEGVDGRGS
jgi:hypothetical protein